MARGGEAGDAARPAKQPERNKIKDWSREPQMQPSGRSFCMLAAEWRAAAMRKLAAVCERAIGRTEQQGGEQPLKRLLLFLGPG